MEEGSENIQANIFESSVSELQLSAERGLILKEGFLSAKQNKDLLQARLISGVWSSKSMTVPQEVQELTRNLEQEWEGGTINVKFDTQLEDENVVDEEEIVFRKIQRCTDQNDRLKSGEGRVFAVVIPSYWREEEGLPRTLDSIREQRFDDTVIVVVSDNNDGEGRKKFDVVGLAKKGGANIATGSIPGNIAFARRKGIDRALRSKDLSPTPMVLVTTDSDSRLQPMYFQSVREAYLNKNVIASSGPILFDSQDPIFRQGEQRYEEIFRRNVEKGLIMMSGANTTIRADIYQRLGGYCLDYKVAEDGNLSQKVRDYLKYEGNGKGEIAVFVEGQKVLTSARKMVDDEGKYDPKIAGEYNKSLMREFYSKVTHPEGLSTIVMNSRDYAYGILMGQLRRLIDRFGDLKYLYTDRQERVRNLIRILRKWDNFYQRVNNFPEVREAVLNDTQRARDDIDSTFQREFQERGLVSTEAETSVLAGTVLREENREVSVFVFKKKSEKDEEDRYLAVEVKHDPSSDKPPIISSLVEIDEGASERLTKVSWYPERMYFHPDDDYPRVATLIFNTHHSSISKVPTEKVNILIGEEEIRDKARLLFAAYENSRGEDNKAVEILRDYINI